MSGLVEVFWTSEGAIHLLGELATHYKLVLVVLAPSGIEVHQSPFSAESIAGRHEFYLASLEQIAAAGTTGLSRVPAAWRWMRVLGGGQFEQPTPMLELAVVTGGPAGALLRLRRQLINQGASRVLCVNHFARSEQMAKRALATPDAVARWNSGMRWIRSRGDAHVEYRPVVEANLPNSPATDQSGTT